MASTAAGRDGPCFVLQLRGPLLAPNTVITLNFKELLAICFNQSYPCTFAVPAA